MEWFAMAIPLITALFLLRMFKHHTVWWEFIIPVVVSLFLILLFKFGTETMQTLDTEYWGGWITKAEEYERWNELCSRQVPEYNSKGELTGYRTEWYVDSHPPYWVAYESNGDRISINKVTFEMLSNKFSSKKFVDLRRSYHTVDGDKYVATWSGTNETLEPAVTIHHYENKVQASDSVFNFQEVDKEKIKQQGLFEYPKLYQFYKCNSILGNSGPTMSEANVLLNFWNAKLGKKKQVRMWVLVFNDKSLDAGFLQEQYWKRGNKNEFVVTIGVDKEYNVQWSYVFSWTKVEQLKIEARNFVLEQKELNLVKLIEWLSAEIDKRFVRRPFAEFNYLKIDPPWWAIVLIYVTTLAVNVGLSFWIVLNEFSDNN